MVLYDMVDLKEDEMAFTWEGDLTTFEFLKSKAICEVSGGYGRFRIS